MKRNENIWRANAPEMYMKARRQGKRRKKAGCLLENMVLLIAEGGPEVHTCTQSERVWIQHGFEMTEQRIGSPVEARINFSVDGRRAGESYPWLAGS